MNYLKSFFANLSIHKKLAIGIFSIIFFIFFSTALIALNVANKQTSNIVEELIGSNIKSNSEFLSSTILANDQWNLFKFLKALTKSSVIKTAGIINTDNEIIAHSLPKEYKIGDSFRKKDSMKTIEIFSNGLKIASIVLEVEKSSINDMLKSVFIQNAFFLLLTAVFSFFIASISTKQFLNRFKIVVSNMSAISQRKWKEIQKNPSNEKDELGSLINQSILIMDDIKEGIKKEEELRVFYRDILKSIDSLIIICDTNMNITYHNNNKLANILLDESKVFFNEAFLENLKKQSFKKTSFNLKFESENIFYLFVNIQYLDNRLVIHISDITKLKQVEENEMAVSSLKSLGEISSQFAHEVKNLIQPLTLLIPKDELPDKEDLPIIHSTILKMREQVSDFLFLGKPIEIDDSSKEDAIAVLNEAIELFTSNIQNKNIHLNINTPEHLYLALNKKHIELIVVNLLKNAIEASFKNEEIKIVWKTLEKYSLLSITNTGENIEDSQKIFKPFFTTKQEGSGLGLFSIYKLIHTLKGRIEVRSSNNLTNFKIYIPNRIIP